jgi:phosphoribosylformylglycinamidine synthase PurS subunit
VPQGSPVPVVVAPIAEGSPTGSNAIVTDQSVPGEPSVRHLAPAPFAACGCRVRCVPGDEDHGKAGLMARIIVEVMLKPEIHDPQGEAISRACQRLGFTDVRGVRQGKRFEVEVSGTADETALARMSELAGELLANPVIEEFTLREG